MTTQCGICLADHLAGPHCKYCGSLQIGRKFFNMRTGKEIVRALPMPVHKLIDSVVARAQQEKV